MKKIFVYGSLKSNRGNHHFLDNDESYLLGSDTISGNFTMVSLGAFPGVIPVGEGNISGEVYEVSDSVYKRIERLEGYSSNPLNRFYDKMEVETVYGKADMYILDESYLNYKKVESGVW